MIRAVDDTVWKALADPTRRRVVDALAARPSTTGELVERFAPELVRTAVMKHLDVLEAAGLVRVERAGRSRWNHLERKPLVAVSGWLDRRTGTHRRNLQRLRGVAETRSGR